MAGPYGRRHRQGLEQMSDKPTMLAWAMKDPVFPPDFIDAYWKRSLAEPLLEQIQRLKIILEELAEE